MIFSFDELAGNAVTINLIKRSLMRGVFKQVSLFSGPRGTGKSSAAHAVAMALTCEAPENGLACGKCPTCEANRKALQCSGASSTVKIANLGKMSKSEDVFALIKDVFELQSTGRNQVYLFEEAHALKGIKNGYTALLAEIDRMSPNTFIVMCTTNPTSIDEALRSRALQFEFKRLSNKESLALAKRITEKKGIRVPEDTLKLIVQYCKGIPREIEKLVDFVMETSVSFSEVQEFLQFVPNSTFVEVFSEMARGSLVGVIEVLNSLIAECSTERIVDSLKNFVIEAVFYLESGHSEVFTVAEKKSLREVFNSTRKLSEIVGCVDRLSHGCNETDLTLTFLKLAAVMQGQKENSISNRKSSTAAKEQRRAEVFAESRPVSNSKPALAPLTAKSLEKF